MATIFKITSGDLHQYVFEEPVFDPTAERDVVQELRDDLDSGGTPRANSNYVFYEKLIQRVRVTEDKDEFCLELGLQEHAVEVIPSQLKIIASALYALHGVLLEKVAFDTDNLVSKIFLSWTMDNLAIKPLDKPITFSEKSDFEFVVVGSRFPCHKRLLSKRSPFFHTLFTYSKDEESMDLGLVEPSLVTILWKYLYNEIRVFPDDLSADQAIVLCGLAERLRLDLFKREGIKYLRRVVTTENVKDIYTFALQIEDVRLRFACEQVASCKGCSPVLQAIKNIPKNLNPFTKYK